MPSNRDTFGPVVNIFSAIAIRLLHYNQVLTLRRAGERCEGRTGRLNGAMTD